ncbi:uncharacterized protein CBL_09506 [Carabus blaptoides fortunei]
MTDGNIYLSSLISGGAAGLAVDISLFPLDTLKTRLQAPQGFLKAGAFRGIYKGLGPQAIGSAPTAALFFCTYESFKTFATPYVSPQFVPLIHMTGASLAEVVACIVRVPVEIVKQRRQTSTGISSFKILTDAYRHEGLRKGLYRGFGTTVLREIPFSFIQFPIYEYLKVLCSRFLRNGEAIPSYQVSICGAIAGSIAAAVTTPLDVAKTRIMLADRQIAVSLNINTVLQSVYHEKGFRGLFAGFVPRVLWITLGGAIFFGAYDVSRNLTQNIILKGQTDRLTK